MSELTLPQSYESQTCPCGASLYARHAKGSDGVANFSSCDVVIACEQCEAVHSYLAHDSEDPETMAELAEAFDEE